MKVLHDIQIKVRLSEADNELLDVISRRRGIAKAALARAIIKRSLNSLPYEAASIQNARPIGRG